MHADIKESEKVCVCWVEFCFLQVPLPSLPGLRIKETKEVYEGEVTELTPCETENPMGGYGKTISHVIIGLKTAKGTKQLKVSTSLFFILLVCCSTAKSSQDGCLLSHICFLSA